MSMVRIKEICTKITSGGTPSRSHPEYFSDGSDGHFWVKSKELLDGSISTTEERISDLGLRSSSAKYLPAHTVLVAMYGVNVGQLAWLRTPATLNQAICGLVVDPEKADFRYVFYALMETRAKLVAQAQGAAQQNLNQDKIRDFELPVPPLDEQGRIASTLSAYDDLIENNTRRIAILEEMARRIYEEWFVRFRYPGHEGVRMVDSPLGPVPEGWSVQGLYDVAELTYGFPFKSKLFDCVGDGVGVIRIRDIKGDSTNTFTTEPADSKYRVENGDMLIGMDGEFHMGRWAGGDAWLNQRVVRLRPHDDVPRSWLFWVTEGPIKHLEAIIVGTTVAHLSARDLKEMKLVVPDAGTLKRAASVLEPIYDLELGLKQQNTNLRATRDLLLPKLISGELDVSHLPLPEAAAA